MKNVPVEQLKEGMVLSQHIILSDGILLLGRGTVLKPSYITKIKELHKYDEVLISENITDEQLLEELRHVKPITANSLYTPCIAEAIKTVRNVFAEYPRKTFIHPAHTNQAKQSLKWVLDKALNESVKSYLGQIEEFSHEIIVHSSRVAVLSYILGNESKLSKECLIDLVRAALLHDIGDIKIELEILKEKNEIQRDPDLFYHPIYGYDYLLNAKAISNNTRTAILQHHEKFNGEGYPKGLKGTNFHFYGHIVALGETYDVLTYPMFGKDAYSPSASMEWIIANSNQDFMGELVQVFFCKIIPYPEGEKVVLSNGYSGTVVKNYEEYFNRPKVRVTERGNKKINPFFIDLRNEKNLNVTILHNVGKNSMISNF